MGSSDEDQWSLPDVDPPALDEDRQTRLVQHGPHGRPIGQYSLGTRQARQARDSFLRGAGVEEHDHPRAGVAGSETSDECLSWPIPPELCNFIGQDIGGPKIHVLLRKCFASCQPLDSLGEDEDEVDRFVDGFLGKVPWIGVGSVAGAQSLNTSRRTFERRLLLLAAAVYFGTRAHASSLCSALSYQVGARKRFQLLAVVQYVLYDETPLALRALESYGKIRHQNPESLASLLGSEDQAKADAARVWHHESGTAKVLQTEAYVCLVLQDKGGGSSTGQLSCCALQLLCPLQVVDRATAATLVAALKEQTQLYGLDKLIDMADWALAASTCDQAPSNKRAEASLAQQPVPRLMIGCAAHACSNVQGVAFDCVSAVISGCIATSLAMQASGASTLFRKALVRVLEEMVVLKPLTPPGHSDPRIQWRDALLDLTLPAESKGSVLLREKLQILLHSDLRDSNIVVFTCKPEEFDRTAWATSLAALLLPCRIKPFARCALTRVNRV